MTTASRRRIAVGELGAGQRGSSVRRHAETEAPAGKVIPDPNGFGQFYLRALELSRSSLVRGESRLAMVATGGLASRVRLFAGDALAVAVSGGPKFQAERAVPP
jgi:hypothetical protein